MGNSRFGPGTAAVYLARGVELFWSATGPDNATGVTSCVAIGRRFISGAVPRRWADGGSLLQINSTEMDMSDISANSVLCGMQQFDRAVQNMEETILVPSR